MAKDIPFKIKNTIDGREMVDKTVGYVKNFDVEFNKNKVLCKLSQMAERNRECR